MRKLVLGTKPAAVYENLQLCRGSLRLARLGDWFLAVMWTAGMGTYFPWGYIAAAVFPPLIHLTLVTTFSWLFCVCNARTAPWFGHCGRRVRVIFWCCFFFLPLSLSAQCPGCARHVNVALYLKMKDQRTPGWWGLLSWKHFEQKWEMWREREKQPERREREELLLLLLLLLAEWQPHREWWIINKGKGTMF